MKQGDRRLLDALAVADSGALSWAVLGMQAMHECDFPESSSLGATAATGSV
jgi:hypothetical protein